MAASSASSPPSKQSPPRTSCVLQAGPSVPIRGPAPLKRVFFPRRLLPGNATERPARKEFLVSAATVSWKNGKPRHFLMEFAEPAHNLVGEHHVIVAVLEDEGLADSLFETAHVIAGVKQPAPRR